MSLIQEALKRKMEEKSGAAAAASPPPPPSSLAAPPPVPSSAAPPVGVLSGMTVHAPGRDRGNTAKIIGMVAGILGMVVVALVLIFMAVKSWSIKGPAFTQAVPVAGPVVMTAASAPMLPATSQEKGTSANVAQSVNPLASITERVSDMKTKLIESRNEDAAITGNRPPEPMPRIAPMASEPPPPSRPDLAVALGAGGGTPAVQFHEFSLWPRMTVNGILAKGTRGRGMAIINNQMISVNESFDGVRLVEVRGQGVLLEFGGESRFVEIGQTVQ
ncbi:MAG: hypothetical protein V1929_00550 [bacterium]